MNFNEIKTKGDYYLLIIFLTLGVGFIILGFGYSTIAGHYDFIQITLGGLVVIIAIFCYFKGKEELASLEKASNTRQLVQQPTIK